ncbi:MAG: beta strand repeat-containing protein [Luteolibacter sp.]
MKSKHLASLFLTLFTNSLIAQTYTWNGGTGPWDTTTANWSGAGTIWPTTGTNNEAVFGGTAGTVTIAAGGVTANDVTFNTSGYILSGAALTLNGTTPTISIGSGTATFNAALAGSGGFTKSGAGTVRLTGANTISGTANVSGGTLELGAALGSNVTTLVVDNATTRLAGTSFNQLNGNSLRVAVTLQNGGVLTADGTTNNAHNLGTLTLNGGTLASAGIADVFGNFILNNTVTVGGASISTISAASVALGGATRTFDVGDAVAGSGTAGTDLLISSSLINGGILKTGAGTLRLTRQTTYSGGTTVSGGTLIVDSSTQANILQNENLTINNATVSLVGNQFNTISNQTSGTITITSGTLSADQSSNNLHNVYDLVLNGGILANSTAGGFYLNRTLTANGSALSTISAPLSLNSASTLFDVSDAVAGSGTAGTDLLITGAISQVDVARALTKTGNGTMRMTAPTAYVGGTVVNGGTLILDSTAQQRILENENLTINNATVSLVGNKFNTIFNKTGGTITITSGTLSADQSSNNAHNVYDVVLNGGTLASAGAGNAAGNFVLNNTVTVGGSTVSTITAAQLSLDSAVRTFDIADAVAGAGTDLLVSSAIINTAGGISKTGAGTMELSATNSYSGATEVEAGTLLVNGSLAAGSAVTVNGGTLGGIGSVNGSTTIQSGAFISPGSTGTGILSMGTTTLAGIYSCEISSSAADRLVITGALSVSPGASVAISVLSTPTQAAYLIATYGSLIGSLPTFTGVPAGYQIDTSTTGEIKLVQTGGGGFSSWANSWTSPSLSDKTAAGDPDKDGISNLLEYVLGGDPRVSDTGTLPKQKIEGGFLVLSYKRSDASEADTQQTGQWSTNLVDWTSITPVLVAENGSQPDDMEIRIPVTNAVNGKLFGRLQVGQ